MRRKYSKEILEEAVEGAYTMSEVCKRLGVPPATGSQTLLKKRIIEYNIDISHFLGRASNRGKIFGVKRDN